MSWIRWRFLVAVVATSAALGSMARAQIITGHESLLAKHNPFRPFDPSKPVTVAELCKWIDCLGEELRDDGLVVMKQPDVFSQARLTRFRTDFETQMSAELSTFHLVLAARINRLDAATTTSQTALSGALSPATVGSTASGPGTTSFSFPAFPTSTATGSPSTGGAPVTLPLNGGPFTSSTGIGIGANTLAGNSAANSGNLAIGVEPTVYLDEKKRFLEQLNQIRRINLGPDQNDSSGYGLYLVRLPVSITPGECTNQGFGADFSVKVDHEFSLDFLPTTFENLVINDLVDELGPFIYEVIRSGLLDKLKAIERGVTEKKALTINILRSPQFELLLRAVARSMVNGDLAAKDQEPDLFAEGMAKFILRESQIMPSDPELAKQLWRVIAERMTVLADVRAQFKVGYEDLDNDLDKDLADFRAKIEEVKAGNGLDPTLKTDVIALVSVIRQRFLWTGSDEKIESGRIVKTPVYTRSIERLVNNPSQIKSLDLSIFRPFISKLYATVLPDDVKILDDLLKLPDQERKSVSNPLARVNSIPDVDMSKININLKSTRTAKQLYPIAPRELLRFFLEDNVLLIASDAQQALRVKEPRAEEIRSYLRHTLQNAYKLMTRLPRRDVSPDLIAPLADQPFMDSVLEAIDRREFKTDIKVESSLKLLSGQLIANISVSRDNVKNNAIGALCWAIAVDAAVLDQSLREDAAKVLKANEKSCEMVEQVRFYLPKDQPNDIAKTLFNDYVRLRWPIITFSLDPVVDQQNVADSFNLKRDLQLALSFAFSTGQIGFNQLNTFRRQIEQSSDAIALNRTVTAFTHGNDIFGFRFTPRFQNPPNQRTNFGVIASQLVGGGPGPDYQTKKSKLEGGMRELTAVLLIPTFLPTMRMNVSSNWFKLHDPEHLVFHTQRSMEQGRKVQELRKAVLEACSEQQYRREDLRVLQSKLAQLEAMLPMQSKVVQLPFDNSANGFDLFSEGSTALVPELTGFSGVDVIQAPAAASGGSTGSASPSTTTPAGGATVLNSSTTTTPSSLTTTTLNVSGAGSIADVFITGKYLSILDTKVIAGGRLAAFEILSREVVHVQIPANVIPTTTEDNKTYIEVYMSTPNGISNSLLIPYNMTPPAPMVVYDVDKGSQTIDVFYQWLTTPGGQQVLIPTADPGKSIKIDWTSPVAFVPKTLQVSLTTTVGTQGVTIILPTDSVTASDYQVDLQAFVVTLLHELQKFTTFPTALPASATVTLAVQPYSPDGSAGFRVRTDAIPLPSKITLNFNYNATGTNALPNVFPVRLPTPTPPTPGPSSQFTPRPGLKGVGPVDPNLIRTAEQLPGGFSVPPLPPLPQSLSVPTPPNLLSIPSMQPASSSVEAEQVTRLLTGQPLLPTAAPPSLNAIQALAPTISRVASATPSALPPLPAAGAGSPIIVMPAPVVVVGPKADSKPKHKSLFHSSKLFNKQGQRTDQ